MKRHDLDTLMKIRNSREEFARTEVANRQTEVLQQHQALQENISRLDSFENWKRQEETSLFNKLKQQPVPPSQLQDYRNSLSGLIQQQQQLTGRLIEQQQRTQQAEQTLAAAKVNLYEKNRASVKCRELINDEKELSELEARFQEEAELEEAALTQWIFAKKAQDDGAI